jgi:hypothetical protein
MNFTRGKNPKEALDIGLSANAIPIFNIALDIRMMKCSRNYQNMRIDPFRLKKSRWVSLNRISIKFKKCRPPYSICEIPPP